MASLKQLAVGVAAAGVVGASALLLSRPTLPAAQLTPTGQVVLSGAKYGRPSHTDEAKLYWAAEDTQQPEAWWQLCDFRARVGAPPGALRNSCGRYVELEPAGQHAKEARKVLDALPKETAE